MLLSALLVFAPALPLSVAQDPEPPKLQAVLALSIDPGFEDEWFHSSSAHGLKIHSVGSVVCGQPLQVCVFAVGYATGAKDHAELRYDVKITRPDGKSYHEQKDLELCVADGIAAGRVQLAKEGLGISFDPPDPRGDYTVTVEIHDKLAKASASAREKVALVEFPEARAFEDEGELGAWMMGYHTSPTPLRALDALARAGADGMLGGDEPNYPLRGFFCALLRDNPFLEALLLERFPKLEHAARLAALEVLAGTEADAKPFLAAASKEEQQAFERLRKATRPDPLEGPIRDAHQLDEIWGTFFATGRYAPIERMAKALSLEEQTGGEEKHAETLVLEGAARWSLKSNLRYPRIQAYCEWMLAKRRLDEQDAEALKELMEK